MNLPCPCRPGNPGIHLLAISFQDVWISLDAAFIYLHLWLSMPSYHVVYPCHLGLNNFSGLCSSASRTQPAVITNASKPGVYATATSYKPRRLSRKGDSLFHKQRYLAKLTAPIVHRRRREAQNGGCCIQLLTTVAAAAYRDQATETMNIPGP